MNIKQEKKTKKPYIKPEMSRIHLRPEEAVLGACKMGATTASTTNTCASGLCVTPGS